MALYNSSIYKDPIIDAGLLLLEPCRQTSLPHLYTYCFHLLLTYVEGHIATSITLNLQLSLIHNQSSLHLLHDWTTVHLLSSIYHLSHRWQPFDLCISILNVPVTTRWQCTSNNCFSTNSSTTRLLLCLWFTSSKTLLHKQLFGDYFLSSTLYKKVPSKLFTLWK